MVRARTREQRAHNSLAEAEPKTRTVGLALIAGGAVAAVVGAFVYFRSRRSGLGFVESKALPIDGKPVVRNGMTLTHYRAKRIPIEKRLRIIQDLTWESVKDPRNRKIALDVTRQCPERDGECEAKAVYEAIKRKIRYTGDVAPIKMGADGPVEGVDLFQSAYRTWEFGGGDCDDHSVLAATLLSLNGVPAKFRVTAPYSNADYSHIYTVAGLPKMRPTRWVAIDSTLPGYQYGLEAPNGRKRDFPA